MMKNNCELYIELAELVKADVAGPVRQQMIAKAQKSLLTKLNKSGLVSVSEVDALKK